MKYKTFLLIAVIFFFAGSKLQSQWGIIHTEADSLLRIGIKHIYNVRFDSSAIYFDKVIKLFPEHPAGYFMDAMAEWWKIRLFRETQKYDNEFLKKIDKVIQVCEKKLDSIPGDIASLFFMGGAYGYRGRYHAVRQNYVGVANDGKKGYDILTECWKIAPGNHDIQLGTGIYNYFVIAFAEEYPALKPLTTFFPKGDKKLGILQLKSTVKYARYANIEAKDVLLQIYYQFENNNEEALKIAEELFNDYPNNPYFHRYLARCYIGSSYDLRDKAEETWREIIKRCIRKELGYDRLTSREALYYVGLALFRRGELENSIKYFYKCDEASRYVDKDGPSGFMIQANLYIGRILDLQGKRKYAIKQYDKILRWKDNSGSHETAKRYKEKPYGK